MDRQKQREIARKGGRAAHEKGTAHRFTSDEAREAGRRGGESVSSNRRHMAEIGRLGGKRSAAKRQQNKNQQDSSRQHQPQPGQQGAEEHRGESR